MGDYTLQLNEISAAYKTDIVLQSVSFTVKKSEFVGLLGGNGSGKTTLLKMIGGELSPKSGEIVYKSKPLVSDCIAERIEKGIVYIHQFPITFPDLFAWENFLIWSSALKTKKKFFLTREGITGFLTDKLKALELTVPFEKKTSDLSEAELQILEFTRCFIVDADLILIDEATSILDFHVSEKILTFLKDFCLKGGSVIFISHRLNELKKYSDTIYELKDNTLKAYLPPDINSIQSVEVNNPILRKEFIVKSNVALDIQIGTVNKKENFYLQLYQKEILGITGLDGSLYEHLPEKVLELMNSFNYSKSGKKYIIGQDYAFLGKNRETDWIFPLQTVEFNLSITNNKKVLISKNDKKNIAQLIEYFKISPKEPDKLVNELSGGNKLKTALGRTLLLKCPVNILDEPFTGIDVNSRAGIIEILKNEATLNNSSFILFSKEYYELLKLCD
jgi:ABC-type sugar transport system ATPase subunit